jgi:hypothetical protein
VRLGEDIAPAAQVPLHKLEGAERAWIMEDYFPARLEHAEHLGKPFRWIDQVMEHASREQEVKRVVGEWQAASIRTHDEGLAIARPTEENRRHIDAYDLVLWKMLAEIAYSASEVEGETGLGKKEPAEARHGQSIPMEGERLRVIVDADSAILALDLAPERSSALESWLGKIGDAAFQHRPVPGAAVALQKARLEAQVRTTTIGAAEETAKAFATRRVSHRRAGARSLLT